MTGTYSGPAGPVGLVGLGNMAKDVGIIENLATRSAVPSPMLDAAGAVVRGLARRDPDIDHAAVITMFEESRR